MGDQWGQNVYHRRGGGIHTYRNFLSMGEEARHSCKLFSGSVTEFLERFDLKALLPLCRIYFNLYGYG